MMKAEKLSQLIDLADKYDYKPDEIHLCNLNEFVAGNASLISAMCKDYAALQHKLEETEALMYAMRHDMRESREKLDAVLADNVMLKKFCKNAAFDADYEAELGMECGGFTDALNDIRTPATDAILNEVRAEAKLRVLSELAGELDARMKNRNTTQHRKSFLGFAWAAVETKRAELSNSIRADSIKGGV